MTEHELLAEAMVIGAQMGGGMTMDRKETLLAILTEQPSLHDCSPTELDALIEAASQRIAEQGAPARLAAVASLPQPTDAFKALAIVAMLSGAPTSQLVAAGEVLGLTATRARAILDAGIPAELLDLTAPPAPEETYLDVLLAAAAADGHIADEELDALVQFACGRREFRQLPRPEIEDLLSASLQGFLDHGFTFWLEDLSDDLPTVEQRQTAYRLAEEMIAVDHVIAEAETRFMHALKAALLL